MLLVGNVMLVLPHLTASFAGLPQTPCLLSQLKGITMAFPYRRSSGYGRSSYSRRAPARRSYGRNSYGAGAYQARPMRGARRYGRPVGGYPVRRRYYVAGRRF